MDKNKNIYYLVLILVLLIAGLLIRVYDIQDALLDFHSTRQLHSALMARGMYFSITPNSDFSELQRQTAIRQWQLEGLVEPPLLEWLVALTYRLAGGVYLWIARFYSILFWMLAAIGILLISKEIVGRQGALVSLALFLFFPYSIYASRSFQPETLLVASLVFVTWSTMKWDQHRSWMWAIVTGVLGGGAILIKAVAVFFVAGILLGLLLSRMKITDILKNRQLWMVGFLCLLPYILFMLYANFLVGGYAGQFSLRFFPQLWTQIGFYLRWVDTLRKAIGLEWLVLGLLGTILVKEKHWRWMLMGAWIGYLLLGFTLSYHISSHDYYNLPVYLMISLGVGTLLHKVISIQPAKRWINIAAVGLLLFTVAIYGYESYSTLKKTNYSQEESFWQEMGAELGSSSKVVALSEDYGYRLSYWGWLTPVNWMSTDDIRLRAESGQTFDFQQYFKETVQDKDYFLVTLLDEFNLQTDLKQVLMEKYPIKQQSSRYLLFDLKHPIS
jgi:4-amino-4-deoxy-L-arabinose transferase-like glycosyltransferase